MQMKAILVLSIMWLKLTLSRQEFTLHPAIPGAIDNRNPLANVAEEMLTIRIRKVNVPNPPMGPSFGKSLQGPDLRNLAIPNVPEKQDMTKVAIKSPRLSPLFPIVR